MNNFMQSLGLPETGEYPLIDPSVLIRKTHLLFTDGDKGAAMLIEYFKIRHEFRLQGCRDEVACGFIEPVTEGVNKHLLQPHSEVKIEEIMFGALCKNSIRKGIGILEEKGLIKSFRNPSQQHEQTNHYLYVPDVLNEFIKSNFDMETGGYLGETGHPNTDSVINIQPYIKA